MKALLQSLIIIILLCTGASAKECSDIFEAVTKGEYDTVQKLIDNRCDVNVKDRTKYFFDAGQKKHMERFMNSAEEPDSFKDSKYYLVDREYDHLADETIEVSLLTQAALYDCTDIAKLLIEEGADVNSISSPFGGTPLMIAANHGNLELVKYLIDNGADIHIEKDDGNTALVSATNSGDIVIVKLLVEMGANVNAKKYLIQCAGNIVDTSALMNVSEAGYMDIVKYLVENGADINYESPRGKNAIVQATKNGHSEIAKYLVEKGANTDASGFYAPLINATRNGDLKMLKYLVEKGARLNDESNAGTNAIAIAAAKGHFEIVKYLVSEGAPVNSKYDKGGMFSRQESPLFKSAKSGNLEITKYLIEKGADVNFAMANTWANGKAVMEHTPLTAAAEAGNFEIFNLLLEKGAVINEVIGGNALENAARSGNLDIVKTLIEKGIKPSMTIAMSTAIRGKGDAEMVKLLIKNGDKADYGDLETAACSAKLDLVKYFIESGMDIEENNFEVGKNILIRAIDCARGHDVMRYLIEKGVDINTKTRQGRKTALISAAYYGDSGFVEFLIERGADVSIIDYADKTALMWAKKNGHDDIIEMLKNAGAKE